MATRLNCCLIVACKGDCPITFPGDLPYAFDHIQCIVQVTRSISLIQTGRNAALILQFDRVRFLLYCQ